MNTINNLPDGCGCGTSASIAYMGHSAGCVEFLHLHERESHEVLLAILKKKNRTFGDDSVTKPKRAKFDQQENIGSNDGNTADILCTKETSSELSQSSANALSMLVGIATFVHIPPNNPPNPSSITDTTIVNEAEHLGDGSENEEMPPLEDITD